MYLVGIDVGTTNTKTVIFDSETGSILAVGSSRTIVRHPAPEWNEFDAEDLWNTVLQSIQAAVRQCDHPERIGAISVASMGESAFPLDADSNVLYPAIAWYDRRTVPEGQWWENTVGRERIYSITGHIPQATFGINKLLWLRNHVPQVFEHIHSWLCIEDFVLWKLSGSIATDYSIASRTMLFDQQTLTWSETLLQQARMPAAWFPPAFPSGTAIGNVRKDIAAQTGIPPSTIVSTGGHDHLCGALSAGVTRPGHLLESMGTASVILAISNAFHPNADQLTAGFNSYAYVIPHTYVTLGTLNFAGGALEWIVSLLYGQGKQETVSPDIYAQALREASEVPPGSHGTIIIPSFLGSGSPYKQLSARGAMLGLTPSSNRPELVRALMEGLAYWLRDNIEMFRTLGIGLFSHPVRTLPEGDPLSGGQVIRTGNNEGRKSEQGEKMPTITVIGGATQAIPLLQIKAAITGCQINVPQIAEAAATGAALLAGMGANIFPSGEAAAATVRHTVQTYEPDPQVVEIYNTMYEQSYLPLRRLLM